MKGVSEKAENRDMVSGFSRLDIQATKAAIASYVTETPVAEWPTVGSLAQEIGLAERKLSISAKLELLQVTGTFKPRGAISVMLNLSAEERARGVVAVSAGNHAIAVAYAASVLGVSARICVPKSMNPARVAACERYGQKLEFCEHIHAAFAAASCIAEKEGRSFVHPFEGKFTALGTATLGAEFLTQVPDLDVLLVAIGGGGLAAGVARAAKLIKPELRVIGVEPFGADSMWQSFEAGKPIELERVSTIADTLGAPRALPYSFGLCREHVDSVVRVTDDELRRGMLMCFNDLKLAVEPAGAAVIAALLGPLRDQFDGQRVGVIICGSNIDAATYNAHLSTLSS